eukprot:12108614-Alexandrium_andersonii.AAC.1
MPTGARATLTNASSNNTTLAKSAVPKGGPRQHSPALQQYPRADPASTAPRADPASSTRGRTPPAQPTLEPQDHSQHLQCMQ